MICNGLLTFYSQQTWKFLTNMSRICRIQWKGEKRKDMVVVWWYYNIGNSKLRCIAFAWQLIHLLKLRVD